jgi:hypothetical protein
MRLIFLFNTRESLIMMIGISIRRANTSRSPCVIFMNDRMSANAMLNITTIHNKETFTSIPGLSFSSEDPHGEYPASFDTLGVSVFLQVESGLADVPTPRRREARSEFLPL